MTSSPCDSTVMEEILPTPSTRRAQEPNLRPIQRLMGLIADYPDPDSREIWQSLMTEIIEDGEFEMAMDHALYLYFRWFRDDVRSLFRLLSSSVSSQALERLLIVTNTLAKLAEDAHALKAQMRPNRVEVIRELVEARWETRWAVQKLDRSIFC